MKKITLMLSIAIAIAILIIKSPSFADSDFNIENIYPLYNGTANIQGGYRFPLGFYGPVLKPAPVFGVLLAYNPQWFRGFLLDFETMYSNHPFKNIEGSSVTFVTFSFGPTLSYPLVWGLETRISIGFGSQLSILEASQTKQTARSFDPYGQARGIIAYNLPWGLDLYAGGIFGLAVERSSGEMLKSVGAIGGITYHWDPLQLQSRKASKLRIARVSTETIFTAKYPLYRDDAIGKAYIVNKSDRSIREAKVSIHFPDYSDSAHVIFKAESIAKGEEVPIEIKAVFNGKILYFKEDRTVSGRLEISYKEDDRLISYRETVEFPAHGRNAIVWNNTRSIGSFVTKNDNPVSYYVRLGISECNKERPEWIPSKIAHAMWIFDSLGKHGISYASDPQTPYSAVTKKRDIIDTVFYPRELLSHKTGDCDDISALMSALLENVGIETAFVTVPEHIFIMFNTDMNTRQKYRFPVDDSMLYVLDGKLWIPLEITMVGKNFISAWESGAATVRKWENSDKFGITRTRTAWADYPAVEFDNQGRLSSFSKIIFRKSSNDLLESDINIWFERGFSQKISFLEKQIRLNNKNVKARIQLGVTYSIYEKYDKAIEIYENIIQTNKDVPAPYFNLGGIYYMKKEYTRALEYYNKQLALDEGSPKTHINLSLCYNAMNNRIKQVEHYRIAASKSKILKDEYSFLKDENVDSQLKSDDALRIHPPIWDEGK